MELGERLKAARLEAGLSQRQLCGDVITRNMLSQIENGAARPSMDTLRYLAGRLGKSLSWFLEENAVLSPNQALMQDAREAWSTGNWEQVREILESYRGSDEVFDREKRLLEILAALALAEEALKQGRGRYAEELLDKLEITDDDYCAAELNRKKLMFLGSAGRKVTDALPSLDEELLLRAEDALKQEKADRATQLLDAAEDTESPRWNFLRGEVYLALKQYSSAAACYHRAEKAWPEKTAAPLERCYRELEDFKMAYIYACKQR